MGIFGFFNKKDKREEPEPGNLDTGLYPSLRRYNEYIIKFIQMQQRGNYSPVSAYEKPDGEITGFLFIMEEKGTYSLSVEEVISRMHERFEKSVAANEIKSYAILYHSQFLHDDNHAPAVKDEELNAITVSYGFHGGGKGKIAMTYSLENGEISYRGFSDFDAAANDELFHTPLKANKEYFAEREEIKSPVFENEAGLKISRSNTHNLSDAWAGIFGFDYYNKSDAASQVLMEDIALAMTRPPVLSNGSIRIGQSEFPDVIFKTIIVDENPISILPVIKTDYIVDVENQEIDEWANVLNLEAIVSGRGRDTFGIWYFATDYAENRERYLSQKKLNVHISGIAFVVDVYKEKVDDELKLSPDFTGYFPSKDMPNYACFDFIGQLEDFKETRLLADNSLNGYILTVRLITNEEVKDFFTIDIFASPGNMRFKELKKGMKITGMLQMQGRIA